MNTDLIGQNFLCQKHDPVSKKKKQRRTACFFIKCSQRCRKKQRNPVNTHRKKREFGKLDRERKKRANMFPRVRKQTHFFEAGVCIGYGSFYRSLSSYRLTVKLPCGS